VTALIAWPDFHLPDATEVDKQVAAPAETRNTQLAASKMLINDCGWAAGLRA